MSAHQEYRDELAAYALGALLLPERLEVERHLAGCEECSEYLRWLDPAIDLLPSAVEPRTPPATVKRALMAEVNADLKAERRAERDRKRSESGLWGSIWRPVTAGVLSIVLVVGLAVGYFVGGSDPKSEFFEVQNLAKIGPQMEASLEVQGDQGTLHVVKLPGLAPEEDYQAWIQHGDEMQPSSTFDVREDGEVKIDESLDGADGLYITREPEGGSESPTEPILMGVEIS